MIIDSAVPQFLSVLRYWMRPEAAAESGTITRCSTSPDLGWRYWSCLLLSADSWPMRHAGDLGPLAHPNKEWMARAAATVGILLFVEVGNGIKAEKALRLFHGNLCGTGSDGAGADITLLVSGESIPAHRYVPAGKSAVFLRQRFIGRSGGKKMTCPIEVTDMDAASFKAMVHFIYTGTVPEVHQQRPAVAEEEESVAMLAHRLLAAAHRYELDRLKVLCRRKLESGAIFVDMAAETLALAEQHGYRRLKAKCFHFIVETPENLHAVLATKGPGMELKRMGADPWHTLPGLHPFRIRGYSRTILSLIKYKEENANIYIGSNYARAFLRWRLYRHIINIVILKGGPYK
ncbi:protein synthesis inhibitor II-like [Panicum miliaceum]|uniref:rRNA N-glycosidase n=1 Tax=Panicum miliaceum TaxID=4540 RepID=A0A3L6S1T5_PANMI|nr:protein synthesis inhibitor II-like [Panicum miliaceum]